MYWNTLILPQSTEIQLRLTLTWDVLKFVHCCCFAVLKKININMRCIEMLKKYAQHAKIGRININMRCIEIFIFLSHKGAQAD